MFTYPEQNTCAWLMNTLSVSFRPGSTYADAVRSVVPNADRGLPAADYLSPFIAKRAFRTKFVTTFESMPTV
jgi:hypothetical protein